MYQLRAAPYVPLCLILVYTAPSPAGQSITANSLPLQSVSAVAWDATSGRIFAAAGANIVRVDPETAQVDDSFTPGAADHIAVSDDGQYLYAAFSSSHTVQRYFLQSHAADLTISFGSTVQGGWVTPISAAALAVVPGQPNSVLIASTDGNVAVYDNATPRAHVAAVTVSSLYVRPSDSAIFGWATGNLYRLAVTAAGVSVTQSSFVPTRVGYLGPPTWSGSLLVDREGVVFDLDAGSVRGTAAMSGGCLLAADPKVTSVIGAQSDGSYSNPQSTLMQYSLATFRQSGSTAVTGSPFSEVVRYQCIGIAPLVWGNDGIAWSTGTNLITFHIPAFDPVTLAASPDPQVDTSGVVRLSIAANGLAYDASRNLVWASVPGSAGQIGNDVISIDPNSGRIVDTIFAGSEPGQIALSNDASQLFATAAGAWSISRIDLNAKHLVQSFSVTDDGNYTPASLAALPNQAGSVVAVRLADDTHYASNVAVYDNGIRRPQSFSNFASGDTFSNNNLPWVTNIYPGDAPDVFYGADLQLQYVGGTHDIARLVVGDHGITMDRALTPLSLGDSSHFGVQYSNLVVDNGNLFTSGGEMRTPDTQTLLGTFSISQSYAAGDVPVPLSDRNQVAYVYESALTQTGGVTLFDLGTMRPVATLKLTSSNLPQVSAAVRAGPGTIAAVVNGQILLIPLASLQPTPSSAPAMQPAGTGLQSMNFAINAMATLPGTSKLVFSTPSAAGGLGNSIVVFNPVTGQVESATFAGSEPTTLAPTSDGSAVYTVLTGEQHIARVNLHTQARDLVFPADPIGGSNQYSVYDMALGADGGLALSYPGGGIAIFDNGMPRRVMDANTYGTSAYMPSTDQLAFDDSGTILYAHDTTWSNSAFKRCAVSSRGVQWLSSHDGLVDGRYKYAQGLIYTTGGAVVDPERSRVVGRVAFPGGPGGYVAVAPDPAAGRIFFLTQSALLMYDSQTYALLGSLPLSHSVAAQNLVRFGPDGLAFSGSDVFTGQAMVYFTQVSAIPLLTEPVTSPQPSLPVTPGVTAVDLAAQDIAYDPSRDLIYVSTPNSEAAHGDQIAAIDPASGRVVGTWQAGTNPNLLALTDDHTRLYYTMDAMAGAPPAAEAIRTLDFTDNTIGSSFPDRTPSPDYAYWFHDLASFPGQPQAVAAIESLSENAAGVVLGLGFNSLRVYDNGSSRPNFLGLHASTCNYLVAGASASRLYCSDGAAVWRLAVDTSGVSILDSFNLLPGQGIFGHLLFSSGRLYTTTGLVLDPENKQVVTRVTAHGPVAVDGNTVYWLDPGTSSTVVMLRSFDVRTLQPIGTRQINVTNNDVTRIVPCGQGRLAFRAGHEIYIVNP